MSKLVRWSALGSLLLVCVGLMGCPNEQNEPLLRNRPTPTKGRKPVPVPGGSKMKVIKPIVHKGIKLKPIRRRAISQPARQDGTGILTRDHKGRIKSRLPRGLNRYMRGRGGRVKAVYFEKNQKPLEIAVKLCDALHALPKRQRKKCCRHKYMMFHVGAECVRTLTASIKAKALTIDAKRTAACIVALRETYKGCDWVGFWPPPLPKVCLGLTKGLLKKGKICRSSLECADKMACHGLGSTIPGKCWTAFPDNAPCGRGIDSLAIYTRQEPIDELHPQCQGYCIRGRCTKRQPVGQKCLMDASCAKGTHCANKVCVKGTYPKVGEACGGSCAPGIRCLHNKCFKPKPPGASCQSDDECLGGCLRPKNKKTGVCGTQCAIIKR